MNISHPVIIAAASACGLSAIALYGNPLPRPVRAARHLASALIREVVEPTPSLASIAGAFGLKEHRSASYGIQRGQRHPLYAGLLAKFQPQPQTPRGALKV